MVTPIETKQKKFWSSFEGERKDGGKSEWDAQEGE